MSGDAALALLTGLLRTAAMVAGPLLFASLMAGVMVGVLQTATQVNEASVSFVVKALAVAGILVVLGPTIASWVLTYARHSFTAVEHVVAP